MLSNIIFDMGGVMLRWDPPYFIQRLGIADPEDRERLMEAVFRSGIWPLSDLGEIDEEELERRVLPLLPDRLHGAAHRLIFHWNEPPEPIPGMAQLARDCKAAGLGVYLLSNASRRQPEYWGTVPGSEVFDGTVISGFLRCVKPGPEIYRHLLERYSLEASTCLFVDDIEANAAGARAVGMDGYRFDGDAQALRRYIAQRVPGLR